MARHGITYQDVSNAANEIKGLGKNPTIETVRGLLGTGSAGTINMHLRRWKELQSTTHKIAQKENLPDELVSLLKGLWERVVGQAEDRLAVIEENHQKILSDLQTELNKYKTNNQRWQQLYNQWLQEKKQFDVEKLTLEQALEFTQKENQSLNAKQDALLQQVSEKQERIDELNRLHQQVQKNLEHYRESAREQRLLDQQEYEQQKQSLQSQIDNQTKQVNILSEKKSLLEQDYHALQKTDAVLKNEYEQMTSQYKIVFVKLEDSEKSRERSQVMYEKAQEKLENHTQQLIDLQTKSNVLTEQLATAQEALTQSHEQNKFLAHEKWILSQENAQLKGQLKQIQVTL